MTYRELVIKLLRLPANTLDQTILIHNEADDRFYGCTGNDVANSNDAGVEPGDFFLMVNI